ncbi:helix-turn-helix domain-containing protein [Mucilaginibacter sp. Bleaf8]|uniref:helix-turn-helix domain-containing protein n=1 Tax=Mucilaginibacter sp. Bleaf8 TaxID=2834430 RepID=UPI001BCE8BF2|nr:helix-turn-helix domain-containing protein [Mucilaginibacter sp. Bleaf8]MBS7565651.1 helix-turn-helix domain-containing protein [Mucilaginibacter sp. Bleaf8]
MTVNELITKEDLKAFKAELLEEMRSMLQPDRAESKQWIKSQEVRRLLGISPGTLQNLRVNGTLSYTKVGGILYYKQEDIGRLLEGKEKSWKG